MTTTESVGGRTAGTPATAAIPGEQPRKITRTEAVRMATSMRGEGATYQNIATALTERGWRSLTGGPATIGGVASLLGNRPARGGDRVQETVQLLDGDRHMLEIIDRLLSNGGMSMTDRVAACQLILSAHLAGIRPRGE